jgi:hypothetical protein
VGTAPEPPDMADVSAPWPPLDLVEVDFVFVVSSISTASDSVTILSNRAQSLFANLQASAYGYKCVRRRRPVCIRSPDRYIVLYLL